MILTSISLSLLALVAGMFLLDKTKKEGLGKFFSFISWLVIVVALLILLCSLSRGVWRMSCRHYMGGSLEMCRPRMMDEDCCMPMRGRGGMMDEDHCGGMMGKGKMKDNCCEEMEEEDDDDGMEKEIQKEIHIEKDTVKK